MSKVKSAAVFCGANSGNKPIFTESAVALIDVLLERQATLVTGGGSVGLMGVMADHMLSKGGRAVGVATQALVDIEVTHQGMSELYVTDTMAERKQKIFELSDAFIAFPGGPGTLDEFFEIYSWGKLAYHDHPVAILNVDGYFDPLIAMLDSMVENGFIKQVHRDMILVDTDPHALLAKCDAYVPIKEAFWIER